MASEDLVEFVAVDGTVLEVVTRAEMRARHLRHRAVYVLVFTSAGELVVHQRAAWKDIAPGWWDIAFGGVVDAGEDWATAAQRELQEEAGITADLAFVTADLWSDPAGEAEIVGQVFECVHDGPYPCPDGEVVQVRTIALADVPEFLATHDVCPDSVALARHRLATP